MKKNTTNIAVMAIAIGLIAILGIGFGVGFRPSIEYREESHLVGQEYTETWRLLDNKAGLTEIQRAVADSGKNVDDIFWNHGTLLANATTAGRTDVVAWLLEVGAQPDGASGSIPLARAVRGGRVEIARLLILHGANPDLDIGDGLTPRSLATLRKDKEMIKVFER